ncbi:glycine cleavage system protein R [methane-oxidizing endosymbiont of Gigantopelta aegis]|uniref:glycine cleavage system protein R n=1 Tax=methane-oxidizing endosymbiont of Gigantopelta aegis TaxID=2794938 RepID=UPI0018DE62BB|nr:transcriptional regulator [methane-oxidizing endosymbiont of Gigantopelta aegis]
MRLAITAVCRTSQKFLTDLVSAVTNCDCHIIEFRTSQLSTTPFCYVLAEGEWNHIAKLESFLAHFDHNPDITLHTHRPAQLAPVEGIAYVLETLSLYRDDILQDLFKFIESHDVHIEEATSFCHISSYTSSQMLIIRMIVVIRPETRILSLREELLEFCDNINLDAIFEPVKQH